MHKVREHSRVLLVTGVVALASLWAAALAIADNVQNDVVASGVPATKVVTITAGETGATVTYTIAATANDSTDTTGRDGQKCNAADGTGAAVTLSGAPANVAIAPNPLSFTDCASSAAAVITAASNAVPGDYPITPSVADAGAAAGDYNVNPGTFVLRIVAPTPSDSTPPVISITSPANDSAHILGSSVAADYSCTDDESLVTQCAGPVADGAAIDTATVGAKSFTVAAQSAGGSSSLTHAYRVVYDWQGFRQPIDTRGTANVAKAGSSIPAKFSLNGVSTATLASATSRRVDCALASGSDPVENTATAGSSGLQYDGSIDQYTYVWKTDKSWAGTCREFALTLNDGVAHTALFNFTR